MSKINVRKQLEMIGKAPGMFGITREALFVHAHVLLTFVGVASFEATMKLGKVGNPPLITGNTYNQDCLMTIVTSPDDLWAQELSKIALSLLPEGSGEYEVTQVQPSVHDDIP
jgi:hypothetical protein